MRRFLEIAANVSIILVASVLIVREVTPRSKGALSEPSATNSLVGQLIDFDGLPAIGSAASGVALVVFADFECSFCSRFARESLPTLKKEYFDTQKAAMVFRHLPLRVHSLAMAAARAAECAGVQGRFWEMHDALFMLGATLTEAGLAESARTVGLDHGLFDACLQDPPEARIRADIGVAQSLGLRATPSFLIGVIDEQHRIEVTEAFTGAKPIGDFRLALDRTLTKRSTVRKAASSRPGG